MTELWEDLANALEQRSYPGVKVYDPEEGPGDAEGIWLPEIDELSGVEDER